MRHRVIAKNGTITLPKSDRVRMGLRPGAAVDIESCSGGILVTPHTTVCMICGTPDDVIEIEGIAICRKCAKKALERSEKNEGYGNQGGADR